MGVLPSPFKKFVELMEILKAADPSKRDIVVLLLQDILEEITRDVRIRRSFTTPSTPSVNRNTVNHHCRAQLARACQTAGVLYENKTEKVEEVVPEIIAAARDVQERAEYYAPYNVLPLDSSWASQPIMQLDEIKAAVSALGNTRGFNWPNSFEQQRQKAGDLDLLDWLRVMFGFQRGNVRNQREHLILLLANHTSLVPEPERLNELDDRAVDAQMKDLFENYNN
ncbi:hypothetical protein K1719_043245 [Acacia pycnantha]|nr:hypothetical protein K1719_043245 [Acacia pycnantha]